MRLYPYLRLWTSVQPYDAWYGSAGRAASAPAVRVHCVLSSRTSNTDAVDGLYYAPRSEWCGTWQTNVNGSLHVSFSIVLCPI
eukprot:6053316-Prymnesium_polylepis.1